MCKRQEQVSAGILRLHIKGVAFCRKKCIPQSTEGAPVVATARQKVTGTCIGLPTTMLTSY